MPIAYPVMCGPIGPMPAWTILCLGILMFAVGVMFFVFGLALVRDRFLPPIFVDWCTAVFLWLLSLPCCGLGVYVIVNSLTHWGKML